MIVTDHSMYTPEMLMEHAKLIVDTRNRLSNCTGNARVVRL